MKLIINGKTMEFKNNVNEIEHVLKEIEQVLDQDNLRLSHLVINGVAVYQNYGSYLSEQIESITEIDVITLKLKPLVEETLETSFDYIRNAVDLLKPLAESFYQSSGQDAWNQLADLCEGIGWLLETMSRIDQIDQLHLYLLNYDIWNEYVQTMKGLTVQIKELEQAMANRDDVLIGDLILYEILPVLETAEENLRFLAPSGGKHVS